MKNKKEGKMSKLQKPKIKTAYREILADYLIINGLVVTMDEQFRIIEGGALAIKEGEIIDVNYTPDLLDAYKAKHLIDAKGKLVLPGLINTHTHSPMTILRGYADDLQLKEWLYDHIFPVEAKFINPENVRTGTRLAIAEMLLNGTTTFCDMYFYVDEIARVVNQVGIRAILSESLIDFPAPNNPSPQHTLQLNDYLINKWAGHPHINIGISAHAPYSTSAGVIQKGKEQSEKHGVLFSIHVAETRGEVLAIQKEHGMTPVQYLDSIGALGSNVVAAHSVHLTPEDIEIFAKRGVGVAHNPQCNMKLASGVAPIVELLRAGIKVGIGTDGTASNNDLDVLEEIRTAAFLQKLSTGDPTSLNAQQALEMATIGAARVLGMDDIIGSLEVGKRADVIILDMDQPHAHPMYNIYSLIVYALRGSDVETVLVDGRLMVHNGQLVTLDLDRLYAKVDKLAKVIFDTSQKLAFTNNRIKKL